jgi:hypothetical protein
VTVARSLDNIVGVAGRIFDYLRRGDLVIEFIFSEKREEKVKAEACGNIEIYFREARSEAMDIRSTPIALRHHRNPD